MAQISLDQAARQKGIPRQTLEAWAEKGLLTLHTCRQPSVPPSAEDSGAGEKVVDEEELDRVAESVGWLTLSDQGWEETEEE